MARKKKEETGSSIFETKAAKAEPGAGLARKEERRVGVLEYRAPDGSQWRVEQWELLSAELLAAGRPAGDEGPAMAELHARVCKSSRSWMIVKRLFGVMPVVMSLDGDPDDFRVWSRYELCAALGIEEKELRAELEAIRNNRTPHPTLSPEGRGEMPRTVDGRGNVQLLETDEGLLARHGFSASLFRYSSRWEGKTVERPEADNLAERAWFAERVKQWEKLLTDPMVQRVATQALLIELRMRRCEVELCLMAMGSPAYRQMQGDMEKLEERYAGHLEQIKKLAPWFSTTEKQINVTGAVGEMIQAIQEYRSRNETRLVDGIFTALEIQVLLRTSEQIPAPRYRFGWVTYINQTREFLWDPRYKPQFKPKDLAKLDAGFRAGVKQFEEESGEAAPNLEADGPEGEYEDLFEGEAEPRMDTNEHEGESGK